MQPFSEDSSWGGGEVAFLMKMHTKKVAQIYKNKLLPRAIVN